MPTSPSLPDPVPAAGGAPKARPGPAARLLGSIDALANRVYTSAYNPFYRSGALTVALLAVLVITGLYLLLFYRIGAPYQSVARIAEQAWLGRWIRTVHRLAADAAVVTAVMHALRMFAQHRTWGQRRLAWISGVSLLALIMICGWTGYVLVWDAFGQALAVEAARVLDLLPLFSEPLGRAFVGETPVPGAFFFLNLFLHIALPIGMGIALMVHVSRVARPVMLPSRRAMWWGGGVLVGMSVLFPVGMAPEASAFVIPRALVVDVFYGFWLPAARGSGLPWLLAGSAVIAAIVLLVPRWTTPAVEERPPASVVNERLCTGCNQCALDCPYEAITMIARSDGRATLVARVDPALCVSCGICAGSCAPMGVGPAGRTGRDQLTDVKEFIAAHAPAAGDVVVIACTRGAGGAGGVPTFEGAPVMPLGCAGSLHSSVVEYLVRAGAGGVLVLACPIEDCWNREGGVWLEQRLFHEREAELQARVDRRRVKLAHVSLADAAGARRALRDFRAQVETLQQHAAEVEPVLDAQCDTSGDSDGDTGGDTGGDTALAGEAGQPWPA